MRLPRKYIRSFGRPSGIYGIAAGLTMAIENREKNKAVVDAIGLQPGQRVLEIGCGPGVAARHAAKIVGANHVTAIDAAPVMVGLARNLARVTPAPSVHWTRARAERLPFPDSSFDVAFTVNAFHHWADTDQALDEVARVLDTGGRLIIAERISAHATVKRGLDDGTRSTIGQQLEVRFVHVDAEELQTTKETLVLFSSH